MTDFGEAGPSQAGAVCPPDLGLLDELSSVVFSIWKLESEPRFAVLVATATRAVATGVAPARIQSLIADAEWLDSQGLEERERELWALILLTLHDFCSTVQDQCKRSWRADCILAALWALGWGVAITMLYEEIHARL